MTTSDDFPDMAETLRLCPTSAIADEITRAFEELDRLRVATRDDDAHVTFTPWVGDGGAGVRAVHDDGRVEYIYVNPSSGSIDVHGDPACAFVYHGTEGDPAQDGAVVYLNVFDDV